MSDRTHEIWFRNAIYLGGFLPFGFDALTVHAVITPEILGVVSFRSGNRILEFRADNVITVSYRPSKTTYGSRARLRDSRENAERLQADHTERGPVPAASVMIADDEHDTVFDVRFAFACPIRARRFVAMANCPWRLEERR